MFDIRPLLPTGMHSAKDHQPLETPVRAYLAAAMALLYSLWRIWTFTLRPWLHPNAPKEVPYWIPGMGHSFSFRRCPDPVFDRGREISGTGRKPYAIQTIKEKLYFLTNPLDIAQFFRNSKTLSWDHRLDDLLQSFGLSDSGLELARSPPPPDDLDLNAVISNHRGRSLIYTIQVIHRKQLLPGPNFEVLLATVQKNINAALTWPRLADFSSHVAPNHQQLDLELLCRRTLTEAVTRAMYGDHLHRLEPEIVATMMTFDDNAWSVIYCMPQFLTPQVGAAQRKLTDALKKYMAIPESERIGESYTVKNVISAQENSGLGEDDSASLLLMIWWGAHSNVSSLLFWVCAHILFDEKLREEIAHETRPALMKNTVDIKHLSRGCPILDSVFHEVNRLVNSILPGRKVMAPTKIGNALLQPGSSVFIPCQQVHVDQSTWGSSRLEFDPYRFLERPDLRSHALYRPFGGGATMCPGRHIARLEIFLVVTTLLHRFDARLAPPPTGVRQQFPKQDDTRPATGVNRCLPGMNVMIDISQPE